MAKLDFYGVLADAKNLTVDFKYHVSFCIECYPLVFLEINVLIVYWWVELSFENLHRYATALSDTTRLLATN